MTRPPLAPAALAALAGGSLLMFVFDHWLTRLLGVLALFAAIVLGVLAIADPAFLEDEDA